MLQRAHAHRRRIARDAAAAHATLSSREWSLAHGSVHPWTVVHQSADKWRSCQDYKMGTNTKVISEPFTLCSPSDVASVVGPDTHFGKFDLRDGFWSVGVAERSRHHLMVRHPAIEKKPL